MKAADSDPPDLRTTVLGTAAWGGALLGLALPGAWVAGSAGALVVGAVLCRRTARTAAAVLLTVAALAGTAGLRVAATSVSPVAAWAEDRAVATVEATVRTDPVLRTGRYGDYVVTEVSTRTVAARGRTADTAVPVLVIGGSGWTDARLGSVVRVTGRLAPPDSSEHAAVLSAAGPELVRGPPAFHDGATAVRASVREAASAGPEHAADLVPALVTGDDAALADEVEDDFRTAGLTHLTAVSGTNLTLVLAFLLLLARWAGVRGRGTLVVGLLGVAGFVLLARPEPSVVRAAAMGTVALLGLGAGGRAAGVRALGAAVLLLLVVDPWLARSPGFALSVLATGGILFVAPGLRDALARWTPRPLAEAVAVPLAAQLACTPVVAALSGEVSLVAVAANLLVAPAIGPATVLGLLGGLAGLLLPAAGGALGWASAWCAQLVVVVAAHAASLPAAAVPWSTGAAGTAVLVALTVAATWLAPVVLARRGVTLLLVAVLAVVVLRPSVGPGGGWLPGGWPPPGWLLVMCDVGQGDALVVAAGDGAAVVVDAGPEPRLVDRCLDRLGVRAVPAVVLTHFHADHVDGLPGVLRGRRVGEVLVAPLAEPASGAREVRAAAEAADVPVRVPAYGEVATAGEVGWRVLGPRRVLPGNPNDASLVLLVDVRGVRLLLTGDVEPGGQRALGSARLGAVDVLKVPHHGSGYQETELLTALRPRLALVSVGEGNDYGHPDAEVLGEIADRGALVRRTDRHGDVAVVLRGGELRVHTAEG